MKLHMKYDVISLKSISKTFKTSQKSTLMALNDISLSIYTNSVTGLVGPNRSGKSTLLKLILGILKPDSGEVFRFDKASSDRKTLKMVGAVLESPIFPKHLSPIEILKILGSFAAIPQVQLEELILSSLKRVGLHDRLNQAVGGFSRGMTQRLLIAQAILHDPKLLILDEPLEGLDFEGIQMLNQLIREWKDKGGCVILVSHDLDEVEKLCDRVILLKNGTIIRDDSIDNWRDGSGIGALKKRISELCAMEMMGA